MVIKPSRALSERIRSLDNFSDFADELDEPTDIASKFWQAKPAKDRLHIFVKVPGAGE